MELDPERQVTRVLSHAEKLKRQLEFRMVVIRGWEGREGEWAVRRRLGKGTESYLGLFLSTRKADLGCCEKYKNFAVLV